MKVYAGVLIIYPYKINKKYKLLCFYVYYTVTYVTHNLLHLIIIDEGHEFSKLIIYDVVDDFIHILDVC